MLGPTIVVEAVWDSEARVFVATSEDVPGLVAEAATLDALNEKLLVLVPELLSLNKTDRFNDVQMDEVPMVVLSQQVSKVRLHA